MGLAQFQKLALQSLVVGVDTGCVLCFIEIDNRFFLNVGLLHGRHRSGFRLGPGGTSLSPVTLTTDTDGRLSAFPMPTRTGYVSEGWYTALNGGELVTTSTVFDRDTTLYVHWTEDRNGPPISTIYTITFDGMQSMTTSPEGTLSSMPTPTRTGYIFDGWFLADGTRVTTSTVFTANTTVYAHWNKIEIPSAPNYSDSGSSDSDPTYSITGPSRVTGGTSGGNAFTDIGADAYYVDAVRWAVTKGVTTGTSADTFSPNVPCTRAQIMTFLWRVAGSHVMSGNNPFSGSLKKG